LGILEVVGSAPTREEEMWPMSADLGDFLGRRELVLLLRTKRDRLPRQLIGGKRRTPHHTPENVSAAVSRRAEALSAILANSHSSINDYFDYSSQSLVNIDFSEQPADTDSHSYSQSPALTKSRL
jgi:hypothetical protein